MSGLNTVRAESPTLLNAHDGLMALNHLPKQRAITTKIASLTQN